MQTPPRATRLTASTALRLIVLTLVAAVLSGTGAAQTFRGGINGTVVDYTGAAIPGATVTATNMGTGAKLTTTSSSAGEFLFQDLPLGTYTVTAGATGFSTAKFDQIGVSAGVIYTLPIKLSVSSTGEVVEVNAAGIALDTTTVTQTTVLDAKAVADIPLNGRDFTQLISLTPGYAGYSGGGYGSLNGTRANQLNWQIDGVDNNDLWHNIPAVNQGGVSGIAGIILPLDAVDQFSAQTQAGPEGGRNPGGTINLTLRSGTNSLHGSAYYFNRNEFFGVKSPLTTTKQKVRNYNTGFSLGAPFLRDKLFGFVTAERQRFVIGTPANTTLPSIGWQNQAKALLAAQGVPVQPFLQNVLNSLWGANLLSADTTGTKNNYFSSDPEFGYSWNGLGKVDWAVSPKDNLSIHWFAGQGNQVAPVGSQLLSFYEVAPIHVQNIAIVYNRVLSAHITNQLLAGVNYFNQIFNDNKTNYNVQSLGFNTGAAFPNAPGITVGSYAKVGLTPPEGRNDITGHITDQLSWTIGNHEFRFGGEYRQAQLDEFYHRKATGSFKFDGSQIATTINSKLPGCNVTPQTATNCYQADSYIAPLADYLSGRTSNANITIGDPERQVFVNTWFLNAGDSWKLSSRLNVNYGVRYDYIGPLHNPQYANLSVFRPGLTPSGLATQGKEISDLYQRYFGAVSPRLGITYSPSARTVLRAGYGFFYDTINLNPFLDNRPGNAAPNGVEGNPVGSNPVSTVSAANNGKVTLSAGINPFTQTTSTGVFSINPNFRPAVDQNYSLNVEQTIAPNVIAQVGYVGSQARHLLSLLDINQINIATGKRPYSNLYPQYGNINEVQSIGTSNYNSLQTQLRLQNYHRVSVSATYTWSHNLDEVTAYRGALPQNSYNFKGDYGNSDFDTRHNVTAFASYELPNSSRLRPLSNGWQVNSLISLHGGQPFTVHASGDLSGTNEGNDRANQIAPVRKGYQGQTIRYDAQGNTLLPNWLDPNAFQDPAAGTFGTSRRNGYYGPGYSDVDLSVFKNTKIYERATVQFRAEMFNLFNRTNFAPPGGGFVSAGGDFTLNDTIGDYNGAPGIGAGEPFNTQFGLKVIF